MLAYVVHNVGAEIGRGPSAKERRQKYQQRTNAEDEMQQAVPDRCRKPSTVIRD
jgi:hypothetical protein